MFDDTKGCQSFQVIPPDRKQVAQHLCNVLNEENISFKLEDVALLVNGGYPDIRRVINSAQRQSINGTLTIDKQSSVANDYKIKIIEILKSNSDNKTKFKDIRQLIADSKVRDYNDGFRLLFDSVEEYASGKVAPCILVLAEGQFQDSQVVDKEINFMATMVKLLGEL